MHIRARRAPRGTARRALPAARRALLCAAPRARRLTMLRGLLRLASSPPRYSVTTGSSFPPGNVGPSFYYKQSLFKAPPKSNLLFSLLKQRCAL
jgi:hypothetical protein